MEFEYTDLNVPDISTRSSIEDERIKSKEMPRKSPREIPVAVEIMRTRNAPSDNDMTAFERTYNFIDLPGKILGWKFSYNWKSGPKHWLTCGVNLFSWSQFIYSQIMFFIRGDYSKVFEIFALYGMTVSYSLKIMIFIQKYKQLTALHHFTWKISRQAGKQMFEKIQNQQLQNLKMCKLITLIGFLSFFLYGYHPLMEFVSKGNLVPLLPAEMMFLDQTKFLQFLIANLLMSVMGVWTSFVILSNIFHFSVAIFNCSIQVEIIEDDIRQLDALWSDPDATLVERHMLLRTICQKCQDKDNYIVEIKKIFDQPLYFYFCVAYMSQVVCMYEIQMEHWIPGVGMVCGVFLEMLLYCMVGTKSTKVNEHLCYVLTQSRWYTYDVRSQMIFIELLNCCMNSKGLWIGPLAPLSVSTGVQIVKSIYTYYTFLAEAS